MKYRIKQTAIDEFWVEKRVFCFLVKIIRKEIPFSKYCFAKDALLEYATFKENVIDGDAIIKEYNEKIDENLHTIKQIEKDLMRGPVMQKECVLGGEKVK